MILLIELNKLREFLSNADEVSAKDIVIDRIISEVNDRISESIFESQDYINDRSPTLSQDTVSILDRLLHSNDVVFNIDLGQICNSDKIHVTSAQLSDLLPVDNESKVIDLENFEGNEHCHMAFYDFRPVSMEVKKYQNHGIDHLTGIRYRNLDIELYRYYCEVRVHFYSFASDPDENEDSKFKLVMDDALEEWREADEE